MNVKTWLAKAVTERYADLDIATFHGRDPDDAPAGGDTACWDTDWANTFGREPMAHYLVVPDTEWGGYPTGVIQRSNFTALLQDYPSTFVRMELTQNEALYLPLEADIPDTLADALTGLLEYPIYDEEHYYEMRHSLLVEWWDGTGIEDFVYELCKQLTDDSDEHFAFADFKVTRQWISDQVWAAVRREDNDPTYEDDANTVCFTTEFMDSCVDEIGNQIIWDWNARVTWLADRQEGLF